MSTLQKSVICEHCGFDHAIVAPNRRCLQMQIDQLQIDIKTLKTERNVLAMLSADKPQFFNPLGGIEAKNLRDRILKDKPSHKDGENGATDRKGCSRIYK